MRLFVILTSILILSNSAIAFEFSYKIKKVELGYSNDTFKFSYTNSSKGKLDFKSTHLDASYKVKEYIASQDKNIIYIDRVDVEGTAQKRKKPYSIEGVLHGLVAGKYRLVIRRKLWSGKLLELENREIILKH